MKNYLILGILFLVFFNSIAQEKTLKDSTKAYVYFCYEYGGIAIEAFDGNQFLGELEEGKSLEYVCDPGIHQFWVECRSFTVLEADLLAGYVYILYLGFKGAMQMDPMIKPIYKGLWEFRGKKPYYKTYLRNYRQVYFNDEEIEKGMKDNEESIKRSQRYFRTMKLHKMEIPSMTSDMYYEKVK